jgi:hypothetical protein
MKINKPNKRILILCEGVTEYLYAKSLQSELPRNLQRSISIEIDYNSQNDPKSLAEEARKRKSKAIKERNSFDSIWLFFDHDNWPQLEAAFRIVDSEGFCIAYSAICIEHWFILHFENCGRSFQDGAEALRFLKTKWPEYHKTKLKHYQLLKNYLDTAIERAKTLRRNVQTDLPKYQRNPYFTIDKLIDFFNHLKE